MGFKDLGIDKDLVEKLGKQGIKEATEVQKHSLPAILAGKDVIVEAPTGTGKTLAFLLPIVKGVDSSKDYPQALILTPTRELAIQITEETKKLVDEDVNILAAYGGQDVEQQIRKLKRGTHIIIATPGRLLDHLRRGSLSIRGVEYLVLDEADEMITMGFGSDLEDIINATTRKRQTMLFSATISPQVRGIGKRFMKSPGFIQIKGENITLDNIEQLGFRLEEKEKPEKTMELIDQYNPFLMIIFCKSKDRVTKLYNILAQNKYNVGELHGDLSQNKRQQIMKKFKSADLQTLVATDVAARGIDVEGVSHVINYDLPFDSESYIHRIGRTGRIGNDGVAISFVTEKDRDKLSQIERNIKEKIKLI